MECQLYLRLIISSAILTAFMALAVIPPVAIAGHSVDWPRGWFAITLVYIAQIGIGLWLARVNPRLLKERTTFPKKVDEQDIWATVFLVICVFLYFAGTALDAKAWHMTPHTGAFTSVLRGLFLFLCGVALVVWTISVNPFATPTVQVQEDQHQYVVDTGPYAFIRHPMYLGLMMCFAGLSLILGSNLFAILAIPLVLLGFWPRMVEEEQTLSTKLPGYKGYRKQVRHRIFPWIY
ncbi:isoprenylcysteine carboxylmethyltransferase family protein [Pseudovibrio sp. Tun.PSC04-5.I4]|uniref:methyltransferase family protein n=1 Tax=Pseudovibrio sp. Tun.PSC04-5.I4 TaxID=1798213 RepID=UPI0008872872|nr:isoprenylcysteine carboxylmethyltransferase family protein [Pseudovibrio sp. Tun.PSC04-5.I4]SDR27896.1 Protein-S-isoprenylcysteine O-methyltransferase Ste14 [Pseudovibrio sp. Tun.PSC04-5.I4]